MTSNCSEDNVRFHPAYVNPAKAFIKKGNSFLKHKLQSLIYNELNSNLLFFHSGNMFFKNFRHPSLITYWLNNIFSLKLFPGNKPSSAWYFSNCPRFVTRAQKTLNTKHFLSWAIWFRERSSFSCFNADFLAWVLFRAWSRSFFRRNCHLWFYCSSLINFSLFWHTLLESELLTTIIRLVSDLYLPIWVSSRILCFL